METTIVKTTVLKASEGKVLRRKSDGLILGDEIYLVPITSIVENW